MSFKDGAVMSAPQRLLRFAACCRDLDSIEDHTERMELALRGVFAGNIFDLGAAESTALFNAEGGVRCFGVHRGCMPSARQLRINKHRRVLGVGSRVFTPLCAADPGPGQEIRAVP